MEHHQVITFLARRLREHGCLAHLAKPEQIVWRNGSAFLDTAWYRGPVDLIVKFYQAEWLARLPRNFGWEKFFRRGKTIGDSTSPAARKQRTRNTISWVGPQTKHC